jgi:hypothetical protein
MTEIRNSKQYDLEDRTFAFARDVQEATELTSIFGSIVRKNE